MKIILNVQERQWLASRMESLKSQYLAQYQMMLITDLCQERLG